MKKRDIVGIRENVFLNPKEDNSGGKLLAIADIF